MAKPDAYSHMNDTDVNYVWYHVCLIKIEKVSSQNNNMTKKTSQRVAMAL